MSIAGIRSNRGDGYQTLVAFELALTILTNNDYQWIEVDSASLDASGKPVSVDDIVVGKTDGTLICCQCKKNQPNFKPWSVSDLGDELVKAALFLNVDSSSTVRFYTRGTFGSLAKLREHSTTQPDEKTYKVSLTKEHVKTDADLAGYITEATGLTTFDFLQRTTFEMSPELERMKDNLLERLDYLASNANGAFNALWTKLDLLGARIESNCLNSAPTSHRIDKEQLREALNDAGCTLVSNFSENELRQSLESTSAIGRHWCREINGQRFPNQAFNDLTSAIDEKKSSVLLTGMPGSGKTCVMMELQEALERRSDITSLFIQSREFSDCSTPEAMASYGLPTDIVERVARMADIQHTVVVIDSLDVLSIARDINVLSYFLALIDRFLLLPNVTLITACREFDRKYDRRIAERNWDLVVTCSSFDWDSTIVPLLNSCSIEPDSLDLSTRELIRNPRELSLFMDVVKSGGEFNEITSQALVRKYLDLIVRKNSCLGDSAMIAIEQVASDMLISRALTIPRNRFKASEDILANLLSNNVLHQSENGAIEFGHQTLLDVLVVSKAERDNLNLKTFIESLPPVPFVRPSIRTFIAYLAAGDRRVFRKQLRAAFESDAAFHIKRLIAESFAEQAPYDEDWSFIRDLRERHREVFNTLYLKASIIEWHLFWLKYLVPEIVEIRDQQGFMSHVYRIAQWKQEDTARVLAFWFDALTYDWVDHDDIARRLSNELCDINSSATVKIAPLIKVLINMPRKQHSQLARAVIKCVSMEEGNEELLWFYITGELTDEDVQAYNFNNKLNCPPHYFGKNNQLQQLMQQSTRLFNSAVDTIKEWSNVRLSSYRVDKGWHEGFLNLTSYERAHSKRDLYHESDGNVLFGAVEKTILWHAKEKTKWWSDNKIEVSSSKEGAFSYFSILACIEAPEDNTELIVNLLLNEKLMESSLQYELASLLNIAFIHLDNGNQDRILSVIKGLHEDEYADDMQWVISKRAYYISFIPSYLRSQDAQQIQSQHTELMGPINRQPEIHSTGGIIQAPFSFEVFLNCSDTGALNLLSHYADYTRDHQRYEFLVGGKREVSGQLREAASRDPSRFLRVLSINWKDIDGVFREDILDGVATYLAMRYGNLNSGENWFPKEEPTPLELTTNVIDELELHSEYWHHKRSAAKAIEGCAHAIFDIENTSRLVRLAIDFKECFEPNEERGSSSFIETGINMIRGKIADALVVIATNFMDKDTSLPKLLIPTIKHFASDNNRAIRALIIRRLPYLQKLNSEVGWELFNIAMEASPDELWSVAEPCLYYSYHERVEETSKILQHIRTTASGKALKVWGRISALSALSKRTNFSEYLAQLNILDSEEAWQGAATVWTHTGNFLQHREQCITGIEAGLSSSNKNAMVIVLEMSSLFREEPPLIILPPKYVEDYFSVMENKDDDNRCDVYGFDEWLNAISDRNPDIALRATELYLSFAQRTKYSIYDHGPLTQLLTRLFREAEEREEVDDGNMLHRVVKVQDILLGLGVTGVQNWLRDAERP